MADKFFNDNEQMNPEDNQQQEENQLPEAIRLGDKAYTQEELQSLVGLGESARDLETKWNTKIDRLMPEYTKTRQQLSEYEKERETRASQEIAQKQQQGQQLSQEELKAEAARQLKQLLTEPELQGVLRDSYVQQRGAEKLIEDTEYVLGDYKEQGFEAAGNVTVDDVLNHMANTGIRNPEKAMKDMLETEYDSWKQSQVNGLRPAGFVTSDGSSAGSKVPPSGPTPRNKTELAQQLRDFIESGA